MDADVARWVVEYLLRQPLDDRTLNALFRVLPIRNDDSRLKKAMLLRRIESEIAKGSISEKVLDFLERIEELDYEQGIASSDAMKWAYCAVAVNCTLRFLDEREENKGKYFDTVKRIWRGRVWKMERSEKGVGLVSDDLKGWRDDLEAAVWESSVCENVRVKNKGNVLEMVRKYVQEAWKIAGPSFLEIVAGTVSDDSMRKVIGQAASPVNDQIVGDSPQYLTVSAKDEESQRGGVLRRRKHVAVKRSRGVTICTSGGVKITDRQELGLRESSNTYNCLSTPETNKVLEALRSSSLELQAVVEDPLPEALRLAENVTAACMSGQNMNQERSVREQNDVPKPSLMARNSTAHTFEWDDSITSSANHESRLLHLPTPNRRLVSPLKKYVTTKLPRRRKVKKWSTLEEDTLRTGVQQFGVGSWKVILNAYRDVFQERTEVDLKDKWRNMARY